MRTCILVLVLLIASIAEAAPIKGAGATSCGEWVEERKQDNKGFLITLSWIQGFISAYNDYVYSGKNPKMASLAAQIPRLSWFGWTTTANRIL